MGRGSPHKPANENDLAPRPLELRISQQAIEAGLRWEPPVLGIARWTTREGGVELTGQLQQMASDQSRAADLPVGRCIHGPDS